MQHRPLTLAPLACFITLLLLTLSLPHSTITSQLTVAVDASSITPTATLTSPTFISRSGSSSLTLQLNSAPSNNAKLAITCQNGSLPGTPTTESTGTQQTDFTLSLIQPRVGLRFCQVRNGTMEAGSIIMFAGSLKCPELTYEMDGRSLSQADEPDLASFYQGCCSTSSFFQSFDFRGRVPTGRKNGGSYGFASGSDTTSPLNSANFATHRHALSNSNGFTSLWGDNQPSPFSQSQAQVAIDWAICTTTFTRRRRLLSVSACTLGEMRLVAGTPPGSWKTANGMSVVSKASGLGKILNGTYGSSGQSYLLPNMNDFLVIGAGVMPGSTTSFQIGVTGGLTSDWFADLPEHTHSVAGVATLSTSGSPSTNTHPLRQPYFPINFMISVVGTDPYASGAVISSTPFYGEIRGFLGSAASIPSGFKLCDGATLLQADYPGLFAVIGTSFGTSNPATNFFIPDLRGRSPIGAINATTAAALGRTPTAVGQYQGSESVVVPLLAHTHTATLPKQWPNTYTISGGGSNSYQVTLTELTTPASYNDTCSYSLFPEINEFSYSSSSPFIIPVTTPPVLGADQSYSTDEDITLVSGPRNHLLVNASDADSDSISIVLVTQPQHGLVVINTDGSFHYTSRSNYNGPDEFTYYAWDGYVRSTSTGKATITVIPVNDPPVSNDISITTNEDTSLLDQTGFVTGSSDVDLDTLTYHLVAQPTKGGVVTVDSTSGLFSFVPTPNYNGEVKFSYYTNDGQANSSPALVTITLAPVEDAPNAQDDSYQTAEDTPLVVKAAQGVLKNDQDVDGDSLTAVLVTTTSHGTLTFSPDGSFNYSSAANYNGVDSFTYHAYDGQLSSTVRTVTISISSVDDAPVAVADTYTMKEGSVLNVPTPPGILTLLSNDGDIDTPMSDVRIELVDNVQSGTLVLNLTSGAFKYTAASGVRGQVTFTYRLNDGQLVSPPATVTINISPVNHLPVVHDDAYTTEEDTTISTTAATGVLANDVDTDSGDVLKVILRTNVAHGSLKLLSDGSFVLTPSRDYFGSDSFTYYVNDGTSNSSTYATVSFTFTAVNDVPYANADSYPAVQNTLLTIAAGAGVLSNDGDVDTPFSSLTAILDATTLNGTLTLKADGSFTYRGNTNFVGQDSFTYHVNDGSLNSPVKKVTLTVAPAPPSSPSSTASSSSSSSSSTASTSSSTSSSAATSSSVVSSSSSAASSSSSTGLTTLTSTAASSSSSTSRSSSSSSSSSSSGSAIGISSSASSTGVTSSTESRVVLNAWISCVIMILGVAVTVSM